MAKPGQGSSSFSVFDYLEASSQNTTVQTREVKKEDTPVCTPTTIEQTSSTSEIQEVLQEDEPNEAPKNISDTLARLLADDTVSFIIFSYC